VRSERSESETHNKRENIPDRRNIISVSVLHVDCRVRTVIRESMRYQGYYVGDSLLDQDSRNHKSGYKHFVVLIRIPAVHESRSRPRQRNFYQPSITVGLLQPKCALQELKKSPTCVADPVCLARNRISGSKRYRIRLIIFDAGSRGQKST
jgi:hypothetical protein